MPVNNSRQTRRFTAHQVYQREAVRERMAVIHNRYAKTALAYAGVTALCLVFCAVYEIFSFGEHSLYMRMMFMMPLLGGAIPFGLMAARSGGACQRMSGEGHHRNIRQNVGLRPLLLGNQRPVSCPRLCQSGHCVAKTQTAQTLKSQRGLQLLSPDRLQAFFLTKKIGFLIICTIILKEKVV